MDVKIISYNLIKCGYMNIQMYWLLVKKEYIIMFVYIISAIVHNAVWIASPKWLAEKLSKTRAVLFQPRPKGIVVKFIYSNHV